MIHLARTSRARVAQTPKTSPVDESALARAVLLGTYQHAAPPASVVRELAKEYGSERALDGISFSVGSGEIFGLLGHNGGGKTTTIQILTGRARPKSGKTQIAGYDVATTLERIRRLINLVFEAQNLYERMPGRQLLRFFADLYHAPIQRVDELLGTVDLEDAADRAVKPFSSGMKQRLLIARSLINQPRVLFLDEPTRGLDPASARDPDAKSTASDSSASVPREFGRSASNPRMGTARGSSPGAASLRIGLSPRESGPPTPTSLYSSNAYTD